jgi:hypothetical protein
VLQSGASADGRTGGVLTPVHLLVGIRHSASFAGPSGSSGLVGTVDGSESDGHRRSGGYSDLLAGQVMATTHTFAHQRGESTGPHT